MGIMEKKMEVTIVYCGLYGDNGDNGKENGNYYYMRDEWGLYRDNGKENGN